MFKSRIKAWRLDKKNKCSEVQEIIRLLTIRKSLGKESVFVLRGRPVDIADIERYARRKRLNMISKHPTQPSSDTMLDLICFTPPPTPVSLHAPGLLRNVQCFLYFSDAFVKDSLQSGSWSLNTNVMGFTCVHGPGYPTNARNGFFLSIERGVGRYRWGEMPQAYQQWRRALSQLRFIVCSRNPSQLMCLVETIAYLAEYESEVAALMLRYLGYLVNSERAYSDTRLAMLQSLSRLEVKDMPEIAQTTKICSQEAFRKHFFTESFFLLDSETLLMTANAGRERSINSATARPNDLTLDSGTYDHSSIRATRSMLALLVALKQYPAAEGIALSHIERMQQMQYDEVIAAAFSHAYSCLIHVYLCQEDYEKAYHSMVLRVENYFEMLLVYGTDLPEDSMLSTYSALESLAHMLRRNEDVAKWKCEYSILKTRTGLLAENEISSSQAISEGDIENTGLIENAVQPQSLSLPRPLSETNIEGIFDPRPCEGHIFGLEETTGETNSTQSPFRSFGGGGGGGGGGRGDWSLRRRPLYCCLDGDEPGWPSYVAW
jgi:hypothetical protein